MIPARWHHGRLRHVRALFATAFAPSMKSAAIFGVGALLFGAGAGAADLYVSTAGRDTNAGTSSSAPLRTIQRAAALARPGTTVYVAPGTYTETISSSVNGTASAHIRFVSTTRHGAILKPVSGAHTMWSVTGGYTDIDGFRVDGEGSTSVRIGIYMNGGNSSVRNSWIHDVAMTSGCDNRGGGGIVTDQSRGKAYSNYTIAGNKVHKVGGGCGYIQGIYHNSSGTITDNLVYATSQAINLGHDNHDTLIMNNTVFGNSGYGVRYGGCKEAYNNGCPTRGIKVHNNIIYGNGGGIQGPIASEDVGNSVANNLVYANRTDFDLARPSSSTRTDEITAESDVAGERPSHSKSAPDGGRACAKRKDAASLKRSVCESREAADPGSL